VVEDNELTTNAIQREFIITTEQTILLTTKLCNQ